MNANDLLTWLSAKGAGTWIRFRAAVDELQVIRGSDSDEEDLDEGVQESSGLPIYHRLRLNLERLGHAEFFRKDFSNGWRVVPPAIACAGSQDAVTGILCGARNAQVKERVEMAAADLRIEQHAQAECPDRIQIIADDLASLERFADLAGLHFQPEAARWLLAAAPPVDNWQLRKQDELPFGQNWDVSRFSATALGWASSGASEARSASFGLFRFKVEHERRYYLVLRGRAYRIPVQVGKFMVLKKRRRRVISYDAESLTLSVPVTCCPPLLIDRALTLCSGLIPAVQNGRLEYRNVSKGIALAACELLRQ